MTHSVCTTLNEKKIANGGAAVEGADGARGDLAQGESEFAEEDCGAPTLSACAADFDFIRSSVTLAAGDVIDLYALIDGPAAAVYTFASTDPTVAGVNAAGVLTGRSVGTAAITAAPTDDPAVSRQLSVTVSERETSVSVSVSPAALGARMQGTIRIGHESEAHGLYELEYDASAIDLRPTDEDTYICTAKAVSAPRVTVVRAVDSDGRVLGSAELTVMPAPARGEVRFENEHYDLGLGDTATRLTAVCAAGTLCEFVYSSSDPDAVSIDPADGRICANTVTPPGESVTVTAYNTNNPAVRADCEVRVCAEPEFIRFTEASLRMAAGERVNLYDYLEALPEGTGIGKGCTFEAGGACVSIGAQGVLTADSVGVCTVTARAYNGAECTMDVRVMNPGEASVSPAFLRMGADSEAGFTISWPEGCGGLYRIESDAALIRVSSVLRGGNADTIRVSTGRADARIDAQIHIIDAGGEQIAAIPVTVLPAPQPGEVFFAPEDQLIEIGAGDTGRFARAQCADGVMCDFIYASSDPQHVQVDGESGLLTPVALSEDGRCAVITATAKNNPGVSATCICGGTEWWRGRWTIRPTSNI